MSRVIHAIFQNGVFKPKEKVDLEEDKEIEIIVLNESDLLLHEHCSLDGIIDLASECSDTDLSIHHDKYLYGEARD